MPSYPKPYIDEHKLATWLREEGYSKEKIAKQLNIARNQLRKKLTRPSDYLSIRQLMLISCMVQRPFSEVLFVTLDHPNLKREIAPKWFDNTGIQLEEVTEPGED